jgi:hypothetical protein
VAAHGEIERVGGYIKRKSVTLTELETGRESGITLAREDDAGFKYVDAENTRRRIFESEAARDLASAAAHIDD